MRHWGITLFLCFLSIGGWGQSSVALQQLLQTPGLEHAAVGIAVKRVADGQPLVVHQADMALTPASVTKLFPTFFALQQKGSRFRYQTKVVYTGEIKEGILTGDVVILAGGDPTLDSRYFPGHSLLEKLVVSLRKAGVCRIAGNIRVEGTRGGTNVPGSWLWEDVSNYYAALYLPFNYRDNTCSFCFQTGGAGTAARLKAVEPPLPGIKIENQVTASVDGGDRTWVYGGPYSSVLCIRGTLPQNRSVFKVKGAMHHPDKVFVAEAMQRLQKAGITVEQRHTEEQGQTELLILYSPELQEIVFHTNKVSVNLFAEALGELVAPASWCDSLSHRLQKAGIDAAGVFLKDACGLSVMNAVPASVFTDLLVYAAASDNEAFERSLPVAGMDGGLSGYCVGAPDLKNRLKAKTGSMTGVRCLAGYLTTASGERLAFSILINHYACTTSQLQRAVGKFLQSLL